MSQYNRMSYYPCSLTAQSGYATFCNILEAFGADSEFPGLTAQFLSLLDESDKRPEARDEAAALVLAAPVSPESTALLALAYHDGIGVPADNDRAFELAEKAIGTDGQPLAWALLGYMCDHAETPDQAEGGPRQKYDHYDAENFYELCADSGSPWAEVARLWLGEFFMNMARGGDPEIALEYYESIGERNRYAAGALSDYWWDQFEYEAEASDVAPLTEEQTFRWTQCAANLDPYEYSYRMGWCYADGIGCDADKGFRLARKYWEDAYGFGDWRAAESIAMLYQQRLDELPADAPADERARIQAHIDSWHALAERQRERDALAEPDPSVEED